MKAAVALALSVLLLAACTGGGVATPTAPGSTTIVPSIGPVATPSATAGTAGSPRPTANQCPNKEGGNTNTCRGPIPAGTYTTVTWRPGLTYAVPEGWSELEDLPGNFLLLPPGADLFGVNAGTSDYLGVYTSVVAPERCKDIASTTVPPTFEGLVDYLTSNPGLQVTNAHEASIGGLDGLRMDVAMKGAGDGCPDGVWADIYVGAVPSDLIHAVFPDYPIRLYLLQNGTRTLAIEMADAPNGGSDIADWWPAAEEVIATFVFKQA